MILVLMYFSVEIPGFKRDSSFYYYYYLLIKYPGNSQRPSVINPVGVILQTSHLLIISQ